MEWVVFDYAGVISLPPPERAGGALARAAGAAPGRFWPAYWADRPAYDTGEMTAHRYWSEVCARLDRAAGDELVEELVDLDLKAWSHLDQGTLAILEELAGNGVRLALLSNAPRELARLIDGRPWAGLFQHRVFSADLRRAKPDPLVFRELCQRLGASPGDLLFVDDRKENVTAARTAGIDSLLFTDARRLRGDLGGQLAAGAAR